MILHHLWMVYYNHVFENIRRIAKQKVQDLKIGDTILHGEIDTTDNIYIQKPQNIFTNGDISCCRIPDFCQKQGVKLD